MGIKREVYGFTKEGTEVILFTLSNSIGTSVKIANFGGIVTSICTKDRYGRFEDIVLGFDSLADYLLNEPYFGAIIGRHANRIEKAGFTLNGVEYSLAKNDGENHLHGGIKGFDKVIWQAEEKEESFGCSLELSYLSKDGEEGYPGNVSVKVTYTLKEDNALEIKYKAVTDSDTVLNLTNHTYFNLSGHASGSILNHKLMINADTFTVNGKAVIPTGEIKAVEGTPMDFTELTPIGRWIDCEYDQLMFCNGYDHNYVLNSRGNMTVLAAKVVDDVSGRTLEVYTTKPGLQLYTGNYLSGTLKGKGGKAYGKREGLCLETQYFPNALRHEQFPSPILKAGQVYEHITIYKFTVEK